MYSPPTDNLYKFIAIAGLLLIGFSVVFPWQKYIELVTKAIETKTKIAQLETKIKNTRTFIFDLRDRLVEAQKKKHPITKKELDIFNSDQKQADLLQIEMEGLVIETQKETELAQFLAKNLELYLLLFRTGAVVGLALTFFGFLLWYIKLQRFIDLEVKKKGDQS